MGADAVEMQNKDGGKRDRSEGDPAYPNHYCGTEAQCNQAAPFLNDGRPVQSGPVRCRGIPESPARAGVYSTLRPLQRWSVACAESAWSTVAAQLPRSLSASSEREPGSAA
jgi:hypothetical protein